MQFRELNINQRFRFNSFSNEIYRKVNNEQCVCLSYEDSEIDEPYSLNERVFPIVENETERVDKFQPMALIATLRQRMQEVRRNEKLEPVQKEHIALGLAWAIAEIKQQAMAKDRYTA